MAKKAKRWCGEEKWEYMPPKYLQKDDKCLFLKYLPSAEQYKKLSPDEKSKLDFELIASIAYIRSIKPAGCPDTHLGNKVTAKCNPWLEISYFFKLRREEYQAISTPKQRAKKVEKKPVAATGNPAKQKTTSWYGAVLGAGGTFNAAVEEAVGGVVTEAEEVLGEVTSNEYVKGAMKYGSIALAGYESYADHYNDYVDYKAAKLLAAAGHTKCKFDDDGQGGLMGTDAATKCKTSADCRALGLTNHICVGGEGELGASDAGAAALGIPTAALGRAIEGTISSGFAKANLEVCLNKCSVAESLTKLHAGAAVAAGLAAEHDGAKCREHCREAAKGAQGICQPGCAAPTFIDFFDQSADPRPDFFELLDSLTKPPVNPAACLVSNLENFFYVVPWQYWLMKNLDSMVDTLLSESGTEIDKLNDIIKTRTVCGTGGGLELDIETIKAGAQLPSLTGIIDGLEIFPLPSLPYMEWPPPGLPSILKLLLDPLQILKVMIMDMICYSICLIINPIIYSVLALMNEDIKKIENKADENSKTTTISLPYGTNINMKKSDVNEFVSDENLREAYDFGYVVLENPNEATGKTSINANHQHVFQLDRNGNGVALEVCHPMSNYVCHKHEIINWTVQSGRSPCYPDCRQRYGYDGVPSHLHIIPPNAVNALVREYINVVNYEEKMTVKDLITLLAGDASCYVKGILITIGKQEKYKSLQLYTTGKILQFWKHLGNNMDIFSFIESSKLDCTPDICPTPIDEELLNQLLAEMDKVCSLMKKPEDLLPITPEDIKAMSLAIGNKMLQDAGFGDSKLDPNDEGAIIPSKTRLTKALSEKCESVERHLCNSFVNPLCLIPFGLTTKDASTIFDGYFSHFEGDIDEWIEKYGDSEDTANKIGMNDDLRYEIANEWCGGKISAKAAAKKRAKKQAAAKKKKEEEAKKGSDAAKASDKKCPPGMNVGAPKSNKIAGDKPCLFVNAKGAPWTSNEVHKYSHSSAVKYVDVVKSLDILTGTDEDALYATIDSMTPEEKDWVCQRAVFTSGKGISGPNNSKWSLMWNICDDLDEGLEQTLLADKLGCKCK